MDIETVNINGIDFVRADTVPSVANLNREPLVRRVEILATEKEHAAWCAKARELGVSVSQLMRTSTNQRISETEAKLTGVRS